VAPRLGGIHFSGTTPYPVDETAIRTPEKRFNSRACDWFSPASFPARGLKKNPGPRRTSCSPCISSGFLAVIEQARILATRKRNPGTQGRHPSGWPFCLTMSTSSGRPTAHADIASSKVCLQNRAAEGPTLLNLSHFPWICALGQVPAQRRPGGPARFSIWTTIVATFCNVLPPFPRSKPQLQIPQRQLVAGQEQPPFLLARHIRTLSRPTIRPTRLIARPVPTSGQASRLPWNGIFPCARPLRRELERTSESIKALAPASEKLCPRGRPLRAANRRTALPGFVFFNWPPAAGEALPLPDLTARAAARGPLGE